MKVNVPIGEAFRWGWRAYARNLFFFTGLLLLAVVPLFLLGGWAGTFPEGSVEKSLVELVAGIWRVAVAMAVILSCLAIHDREAAAPSEFRRIGSRYIAYFFGTLLYSLLVGIGLIFFIVPGLYIGVACQFTPYLIIDRKLGPIEALKESARLTKGSRWGLLFLGLSMVALNILGSLLFGLGLLVTIPISFCAHVWAYRRFVPAA